MTEKTFIRPRFETKINKAVFIHQDLVVYPDREKRLPDNFINVIKFLFGEGVHIREDVLDVYPSLTIENACYELRNVHTIDADWICQEVKD